MTQAAQLASYGSNNVGLAFKNRIINGGMVIDQRNAGASVTISSSPTYTVDRWVYNYTQGSKVSIQQNAGSVTPPVGFKNYLGITSSSSYSVIASDYFIISQPIEGFNTADLAWGTANAKTVTLSFQIYSSLTGTFGGALENNAGDRCYPFSYSVPVANTWTTISITIPGDITGTWLTNNSIGIAVRFGLGCGSTFGSGTAGAWSSTRSFQPSGTVSVVGTNGATFYITGVQLEVGSQATSFDFRSYGTELALCQRYYEVLYYDSGGNGLLGPYLYTGAYWGTWYYKVQKRTTSTVSLVTGSWVNATPSLYGGLSSCSAGASGGYFGSGTGGNIHLQAVAEL